MRLTVWICVSLVAACSYDIGAHPATCDVDVECSDGTSCYRGFCVEGGSDGDAAVDDCAEGARPSACYDGPAGTEGRGMCRAGERFCVRGKVTACFDQVRPSIESCNGQDDDCNGEIDDIASQSCLVAIAQRCFVQGTIVCRGSAPSCELTSSMMPESCNGNDDDCDGQTDEGTSGACFPEQAIGCSADGSGGFHCLGVCAPGALSCAAEFPGCSGAVIPTAEQCTASGASLDEDCDGAIDETCACESGSSRSCYAGPSGAIGQGACREGAQTCSGGAWGTCADQILPAPETCTNQHTDDDCNGVVDDVPGVGSPCTDDTKVGACRDGTLQCMPGAPAPVCVGGKPSREQCDALDQDCDGNPLNGFDLNSASTCGSCGVACSNTQVCCGGVCVEDDSLETDVQHCGSCDKACGSNQYCCQGRCLNDPGAATSGPVAPEATGCNCATDCGSKACCGSRCVDLIKDSHNCGACGYECGADHECMGGSCKPRPERGM
jgi:Putative metal-binding motif